MKKIFIKLLIIMAFFIIALSVNSYAASFRVQFEEGHRVNNGDTLEIPIILDDIDMDGAQKGILSFSCKIDYDENVFEQVEFDTNKYFKTSENTTDVMNLEYNKDSKILIGRTKSDFIKFDSSSVVNYLNLGTMYFKVKDDAKTGEYIFNVTEINGGNSESTLIVSNKETAVYVNGLVENAGQEDEDTDPISDNTSESQATEQNKEMKLNIKVGDDGKSIEIIPDEEKGAIVDKIILDGKEIEKKDGKFVISSEPDKEYVIFAYGIFGEALGNEYIYTTTENELKVVEYNNEDEPKQDDEKKDDEKKDDEKKDEEKKDDEKQDTNKPVQTGDGLFLVTVIMLIATAFLISTVFYLRKQEEQE